MATAAARHRILTALRRDARKVFTTLKLSNVVVEIQLLSDREMRFLEKKYLRKNKKRIDVLSFPHPASFPHPETRGCYLGEVCLNWTLLRHRPEELRRLLIHGVLHLAGYDHDERRATIETREMEKLEERLCATTSTFRGAK